MYCIYCHKKYVIARSEMHVYEELGTCGPTPKQPTAEYASPGVPVYDKINDDPIGGKDLVRTERSVYCVHACMSKTTTFHYHTT